MEYTHVTTITVANKMLYLEGETNDDSGFRMNVKEHHSISDIHAMIVEFHVPPD